MIHIIVYSTTNTAAKMYKKKFKITQEEDDNGWGSCNTPQSLREHRPNSLCSLCIWWLVVFSKGRNIKL